ncbi:MAG: phosphate signaling complex protein PhoU [Spirochaetes bacterium]|nr:phosphate signaling complex protein PhoU [Spirochaetota bacterium]
MKTHLEQDLENTRAKIFEMADIAIETVIRAVDSLKNCDVRLAEKVIDSDSVLDDLENSIDEMCIRILVTKQPAAIHLRLVLAMLKINTDLERIGDLATSIAKEAKRFEGRSLFKNPVDIARMTSVAVEMIRNSFAAISEKNVALAKEVIEKDNEIDALNVQIYRELLSYMAENPKVISDALSLTRVSKSIERIGDHATNIAERAIYYIEGIDVRHGE